MAMSLGSADIILSIERGALDPPSAAPDQFRNLRSAIRIPKSVPFRIPTSIEAPQKVTGKFWRDRKIIPW